MDETEIAFLVEKTRTPIGDLIDMAQDKVWMLREDLEECDDPEERAEIAYSLEKWERKLTGLKTRQAVEQMTGESL